MLESVIFCRRERKSLRKLEKLLKEKKPEVYTRFIAKNCTSRMCKGCFYSGKSDINVPKRNCRLLDRASKLKLITPSQIITTYEVVDMLIKFHVASIIEM